MQLVLVACQAERGKDGVVRQGRKPVRTPRPSVLVRRARKVDVGETHECAMGVPNR